ncbi:MAG: hypothetical protein JEZ12_16010 [Desulfobacterium sp.]|nr:hypothetical protein [Desulfobacterium sp.]
MNNSELPNMTITGDTTIEDMELNDRDNYTEAVEKDHKTYTFSKVSVAKRFMGEAFDHIMKRCGINIKPGMHGAKIDKLMKVSGIKVEQRTYPPEEPLYRSGLFVYKRGELMGFVSSPFVKNSSVYLTPRIYIMTTEKEL